MTCEYTGTTIGRRLLFHLQMWGKSWQLPIYWEDIQNSMKPKNPAYTKFSLMIRIEKSRNDEPLRENKLCDFD